MELHKDLISTLIKKYGYYKEFSDINTYGFNSYLFAHGAERGVVLQFHDNYKAYISYLEEINKEEFIEYVKRIPEFDYESGKKEIEYFSGEHHFYVLNDFGVIKGIVCEEMVLGEYSYLSYLAIFKEYRKTDASRKLIDSIKTINEYILVVPIEEVKVVNLYKKYGFKEIEKFYFD